MKKHMFTQSHYHKQGFVLVYFLSLFNVVTIIISSYVYQLTTYAQAYKQLSEFRKMNFIEVLTIKHIKDMYYNFEEDDEQLSFDDYDITITINDLQATFVIENDQYSRTRTLVYDDINEKVEEYR